MNQIKISLKNRPLSPKINKIQIDIKEKEGVKIKIPSND
jgi:hypothetical protein